MGDLGKVMSARQWLGLLLGPTLFALMLLLPAPAGMPPAAVKVAAVTLWMASYWIMEVIPIPATALLPIALFPLLGVMPTGQVTAAYANHLVYLFMGGFLIAMAIERWELHRRVALHTVRLVGVSPRRLILGFMLATAFLSAWISNTAAAMMMVTIGLAVLSQLDRDGRGDGALGTTLMLAIAYAASIGGLATLIGTPPNAILAGVLESRYGYHIGFAQWMSFGVPLSLVLLALAWWYLTRWVLGPQRQGPEDGDQVIARALQGLGPMTAQEGRVLLVFGLVVLGWLLQGVIATGPLAMITDSSIAIAGALLLFMLPAGGGQPGFLLDWQHAVRLPWDIILLFGGGFALAAGFASSGLTLWLGELLGVFAGAGPLVILLAVVLLVIFLTEVTSNTATASLLLPVMGGFAVAIDSHPLTLMVGTALAASCAFMLPVATPPNAIVFSSRRVTIPQMARAGIWLNLMATLVIVAFVSWVLPMVLPAS